MTKAEQIIDLLNDRKGFDYWWHDIDEDIKQEIIDEMNEVINE